MALNRIWHLYCYFVLLLGFLIGGATYQGVSSDHLIQVAILPLMLVGIWRVQNSSLSPAIFVFMLATLLVLCAQFYPFHRIWWTFPDGSTIEAWMVTASPQRSLEATLFCVSLIGFGLFVSTMADAARMRLFNVYFIAVAINVLLAVMQLSYSDDFELSTLLPYTIRAGVFANENHFSAFLIAVFPILGFVLLKKQNHPAAYLGALLLIALVVFAAGSRAGMINCIAVGIAVIGWHYSRKLHRNLRVAVAMLLIALIVGGGYFSVLSFGLEQDQRIQIYATTISAVREFWPVGSGLGSFQFVYPLFERPDDILDRYINTAHNDYLQIALELGVAGVVLMVAFAVLLLLSVARNPVSGFAIFAIAVLAAHSLVDYPLRTMAVGLLFTLLAVAAFSRSPGSFEKSTRNSARHAK